MTDTALQVVGWLLLIDFASALLLVGLVAVVGRQGRTRVSLRVLLGVALFLGICSLLIYGGLWMMLSGRVPPR